MRVFSTFASVAVVLSHVLAAPAPGDVKDLQERAAPAACASPLAVSLAYDILSVLRADTFCTQWLGITTETISTTQSDVATISTTVLATSIPVVFVTAVTTTVVDSTTTVPTTLTAATVTTTIPALATVFSSVTTISTSTSTITSTSTTYIFDVEAKKAKRAARPTKLAQLKSIADNVISSACSCIATTPTVTSTVYASSTLTVQVTSTVLSTSTSTASTSTETQTNLVTEITTTSTTPITTITSIATLTSPTIVATQTTTVTRTDLGLDIVDVIITPIELDGCTVGTSSAKFANIGGGSFNGAGQLCAAKCVAAGKVACDDFFTQQNLPSGTWDCFLLRQQDEVNTNFHCGNPNIGQAAEWIIIY